MDTKEKILEVAQKLFFKQGYRKTTIRQITDQSGVNLGLFSYYFKNKENIASIIYKRNMSDILEIKEFAEKLEYKNSIEKIYLYYVIMHKSALFRTDIHNFYRELIREDLIATKSLPQTYAMIREIIEEYELKVSESEVEEYVLIVKGVERALVMQDMKMNESGCFSEINNRLIVLTLVLLLGVNKETITSALDRCDREVLPLFHLE